MKFEFKHMEFSKAIKQKRIIEDDINMRPLAKKLGISAATISRCENSVAMSPPDLKTFVKVCKWLNRPVTDFYSIKK